MMKNVWMKSGAVTFALLQLANVGYPVALGRVELSWKVVQFALVSALVASVPGLVFGYAFTFVHDALAGVNPYVQGVLAFLAATLCLEGIDRFGSPDFLAMICMSIIAVAFFVWNVQRQLAK